MNDEFGLDSGKRTIILDTTHNENPFCLASSNDATDIEKQTAHRFAQEITSLKQQANSKQIDASTDDADDPSAKRPKRSPLHPYQTTTTHPFKLQTAATFPSLHQTTSSSHASQSATASIFLRQTAATSPFLSRTITSPPAPPSTTSPPVSQSINLPLALQTTTSPTDPQTISSLLVPQTTYPSNSNQPRIIPSDTKEFVESFFSQDKAKQKELLKAILTDRRASEVLPSPSTVASNARPESRDGLRYNHQMIDLADPTKYRPLQHTAFDWFPPDVNNGTHRSLDPRNRDNTNFNISRASNKSQLFYANKINSFVMNLHILLYIFARLFS